MTSRFQACLTLPFFKIPPWPLLMEVPSFRWDTLEEDLVFFGGGEDYELALDILNIRYFWHSEGKWQINNYIPGPGDFQSQSSENMMLRMEAVNFQ